MYTWMRTAEAVSTKIPAALAWAHEVVSYTKSKVGFEGKVEIALVGNPCRIRWIYQYESRDQFTQAYMKLMKDEKYWDLMKKAGDLFHERTAFDETWTSA